MYVNWKDESGQYFELLESVLFVSLVLGSLSQSISQMGLSKQRGGEMVCKMQQKGLSYIYHRYLSQIALSCLSDQIISPVFLSFSCNGTGYGLQVVKQRKHSWSRPETQNAEEIHQIYTKQGGKSHWALLLVSCSMHSALTQVLSYGVQVSQRNDRVAKSFYFRPLAAKIRRCTVFFCLSLPGFLVRKDPKEIGACLEINVLLDMWNVHREQTTILLKKGTFYRSADSGISKDKGV